MIQIDNIVVSLDLFEETFFCNLEACRGACCIEGDGGAPLTREECHILETCYDDFSHFMSGAGKEAVKEQGFWVVDNDKELCTPLVHGRECAYTRFENGMALCAIEKAWKDGVCSFRKPVSCHLYPLRVVNLVDTEGLQYHRWKICDAARRKGKEEKMPLYRFLKDALIRKYGAVWYHQLEETAMEIEKQGGISAIRSMES